MSFIIIVIVLNLTQKCVIFTSKESAHTVIIYELVKKCIKINDITENFKIKNDYIRF